jgi:PrtD family type I secretion system ABC transporter
VIYNASAQPRMTRTRHTALDDVLSRSRGALAAVGLFSFAINVLLLVVPLHMLHVYDHVLTSRSGPTLLFLSMLAAGLLGALGLLELARSRVLTRLGARLDAELGSRLFAAAVGDRLAGRSDAAAQPLRDLETLRGFITGGGLPVLFDAPWAPFFIAVTFLLHPWLGLVALVGALALFLVAVLNDATTRRLSNDAATESIAAGAFAESALRNAEAIEAMGMGPAVARRWHARHDRALAGQLRVAERSGAFSAIAKFWRPFLQIAMLSAGAWLAIQQVISPGVMIAGSIVMARGLAPVEAAIASWRGFVAARRARNRLSEVLARHQRAAAPMKLPRPKGAVELSNLCVAPPRTVKPVLRGIGFALAPGEALAVIGPSAAGKSTLARALVGIWPALSGEVRLDGAALRDYGREDLGRCIGYLPQDVELFDGTVADNIARLGDADPEGVVAAARLAGVHETILRLPQGYETAIGPGGEALSGGQRQRIALARAVYGEPALVVLDEPNSGLDTEGEEALRMAIAALKAMGTTVVIVAHRSSAIAAVDKILVVRDGAMEMIGPRAEVLARVTRPMPAVAAVGGR